MISILLDLGAKVNEADSSGATVLHFAAREGHKAGAEALLAKGASRTVWSSGALGIDVTLNGISLKRSTGTLADVARQMGHTEVANLIDKFR
jgi:ankyrin repeat protein